MDTVQLGVEDLKSSKWKEIIQRAERKDCSDYSRLFLAEAHEAEKNGDQGLYSAYRFLSDVTSPMLHPDNSHEPFGPVFVFDNKRSVIPDDFSEEQITLIRSFLPYVDDDELRARIADFVWLRKRDHRAAEMAIDSYLRSASVMEDHEPWPLVSDRIERAFRLAAILGVKTGNLEKVVKHIDMVLDKYDGNDSSYLSEKLMGFLYERRIGDAAKYGKMAEKIAGKAEEGHDWSRAQAYWLRKADWDRAADKEDDRKSSLASAAETYVGLAEMSTSHLVAASHLSKAIEAYKRIGGMTQRIEELHMILLDHENKSMGEFATISSPTIDLSDAIDAAENSIKGKNFFDALFYLATNFRLERVEKLKEKVEGLAKKHPMSYFFESVIVNEKGKVVGKRPGLLPTDKEVYDAALRPHMFQQALLGYSIDVPALINPMCRQIMLEHSVKIDDFKPIVFNNPLIPPGREYIYAKGLYEGLQGDLLTSIHLLVPQFENSLRYLLEQRHVATSKLDANGIQQEYDLNFLLYQPIIKEILGVDIIFHLQCLLVESEGANIRNKMAHGLIHHHEFYSPDVIYLWALILRLCCWPQILQTRSRQTDESARDDNVDKKE